MLTLYIIGIVLMAINILIWLWSVLYQYKDYDTSYVLKKESPAADPQSAPFVSVIVPARNEENCIERCARSLAQLDYPNNAGKPNYELIVLDDCSEDRTPDILREVEDDFSSNSAGPEIQILRGDGKLPPGWVGKPYALCQAVKHAKGDWFLFTDADTCHNPESLSRTMRYALDNEVDLLSVMPHQELESFCEKAIQPSAFGLLAFKFLPFKDINDPKSKRIAANGQYILVNTKTYNDIGGHEAVKNHTIEDFAMAEIVKNRGHKYNLVWGRELVSTRMYSSFKELWQGWLKNVCPGVGHGLAETVAGMILMLLNGTFPFILLPICAVLLFLTDWGSIGAREYALMVLSALTLFYCFVRGVERWIRYPKGKIARKYILLYPFGCVVIAVIMAAAIVRNITGKGVVWKGRGYTSADAETEAGPQDEDMLDGEETEDQS